MGHKAHIGLVDAHAEGNRRHHDHAVLAQEAVLVVLTHVLGQAGVIGQGIDAVLHQGLGQFLDTLARLAIDHAGFALVLAFDKAQQLVAYILFSAIR